MKRVSKLMLLFTVLFLSVSFLVFAGEDQEKAAAEGEEGIELIWMPKLLGIDYFNSCRDGAEEAAAELGINLKEDAPVEADVTKQVELIDNYITQQVDIIAVAANDPKAIAPIRNKNGNLGRRC